VRHGLEFHEPGGLACCGRSPEGEPQPDAFGTVLENWIQGCRRAVNPLAQQGLAGNKPLKSCAIQKYKQVCKKYRKVLAFVYKKNVQGAYICHELQCDR
jgi:hypothetical protein